MFGVWRIPSHQTPCNIQSSGKPTLVVNILCLAFTHAIRPTGKKLRNPNQDLFLRKQMLSAPNKWWKCIPLVCVLFKCVCVGVPVTGSYICRICNRTVAGQNPAPAVTGWNIDMKRVFDIYLVPDVLWHIKQNKFLQEELEHRRTVDSASPERLAPYYLPTATFLAGVSSLNHMRRLHRHIA